VFNYRTSSAGYKKKINPKVVEVRDIQTWFSASSFSAWYL